MLVWSILPFVLFSVIVMIVVTVEKKKERKMIEKNRRSLRPVAKLANGLHEKKYGKPSPELVKEFPELKAVK